MLAWEHDPERTLMMTQPSVKYKYSNTEAEN